MDQSLAVQPGKYDVIVVGGGPAGLTAAIALAQTGARTALVARMMPYADNRTTALLGQSVDILRDLGVWDRCAAESAPLERMRLIDDTGRLFRAPEVTFDCNELGLDAFGHNIHNRALTAALEQRAAEIANLTRVDADAASIATRDDGVNVTTSNGTSLAAALVIGADGRNSLCRTAAGIEARNEALDQAAITFNVTHTRPHKNASTEFHTPHGPCVIVPLPGDRSSVVWVSAPDTAKRLLASDDATLSLAIEKQAHSILGKMQVDGERHQFPLFLGKPQRLAAQRIVLVGESAHVLPPIGAQGLNMGLRDAMAIADIVRDALASGEDLGSDHVMRSYEKVRRADIGTRTFAISMANRSLLNEHFPVQAMRMIGMELIRSVPPIKRMAMRQGLGGGAIRTPTDRS